MIEIVPGIICREAICTDLAEKLL